MVAKEVPRPPRPRRLMPGSQTGRPIMAALDLLGRRWVLRLLWELRDSPPGARALRSRCEAMSSNVLYLCLRELETAGPVGRDGADCCLLTPMGGALGAAIASEDACARQWAGTCASTDGGAAG
jgi:DNA-binding HxlR family transcriptional regulator